MTHWLVTVSPKLEYTHAPSVINGWKLHAIEAQDNAKLSELRNQRSACGVLPRHGWTMDLFICEREHRCQRCLAKVGDIW